MVSGKGGTGKTSFTANVGLALAALGKSTLCLDCDITLRNLDLALGLTDSALMDFSDVIAGRCALSDAVAVHPKYPKLHLLTAPLSATGQLNVTMEQMKRLLDQVRRQYDYCLIDAPAGLGQGFQLATGCADCVVVITTTDASALRDAQHTVMILDKRFTTESLFWWWGEYRKTPAGPAQHHRRRHGRCRPSPSGRGPGGQRRPLFPQPRHSPAGHELLCRTVL